MFSYGAQRVNSGSIQALSGARTNGAADPKSSPSFGKQETSSSSGSRFSGARPGISVKGCMVRTQLNKSKPQRPQPDSTDLDKIKADAKSRADRITELCAELESLAEFSDPFSGRRIADAVAKAHGITFNELTSNRRNRHLVYARQQAAYEIKVHTKLTLPQIGKLLGGRDHSTILYSIRAHAERLKLQSGADPSRRDAREASASPQAVPAPSYPVEAK